MTEKTRATIVGAGALGSHLVQFLRCEDLSLRVIDDDRVEQKNVLSQFHGRPSVGKKKVDSLRQSMSFLYGYAVQPVSTRLVADNVQELLNSDLIIDCMDNAESREVLQQHARARGIACVHGALAADGSFGRVVWDEDFVIDSEKGQGAVTCANGEHLPFIVITAAYLARSVQRYLRSGERVGFSISPSGAVAI